LETASDRWVLALGFGPYPFSGEIIDHFSVCGNRKIILLKFYS
jgi:hypothetical protein